MKASTNFVHPSCSDFIASSEKAAQRDRKHQLTAWQRLWRQLTTVLAGGSEPHIWQMRSRSGAVVWHVYDPVTGHTDCFETEREVRIWLDQRYYL